MRISKALAGAALVALAGCANPFAKGPEAPTSIALADGLVIEGATGWCVDPSVSAPSGATPVVVLGSCAALAQDAKAPRPDVPGVVTVSVEQPGIPAPEPAHLETYFASDAGRAALAQDGEAGSIEIVETRMEEDRLVLQLTDKSALPGTAPTSWRGLFGLGGRFVSVALYGLADTPLEGEDGFAALEAQIARLIAANAG